ncbi:YdbC family protein [Mycoplasmopsis iners]|uniref:YdbC family protein n=1 Tax=Mycoplasmopsis iners TaxID=76630 RepID=UPI0004986832|nr:PC4/YdbC family ssDNA-binding protein [Mycoplasmopsis iners]
MPARRQEITYEIIHNVGKIAETVGGYVKELNLVSWNNNKPKYDIRDWSEDHSRSSKGITLTYEELVELKKLIDLEVKRIEEEK